MCLGLLFVALLAELLLRTPPATPGYNGIPIYAIIVVYLLGPAGMLMLLSESIIYYATFCKRQVIVERIIGFLMLPAAAPFLLVCTPIGVYFFLCGIYRLLGPGLKVAAPVQNEAAPPPIERPSPQEFQVGGIPIRFGDPRGPNG